MLPAPPANHAAPTLSVVMPSFNQAEFLGDAVRSVLGQSGPDVELVVMDGGSEDGSPALLAELGEAFPGRLRWHSGPDGGPAEAVNEAVRQARAPLIGWLNSDDLYTPGALARAREHLNLHPQHTMVYGNGEHIDVSGQVLEPYPTLPPSTPIGVFVDGCFICQPTAFFRRETFLGLSGLDTGLRAAFDFEFWLRLFKADRSAIGFIDAVQAQSRLHAGGITMRFRERVAMEGMQVIHRHLGSAPGHWLLTHLDELCDLHPFEGETMDLRTRFARLIERAAPWVRPETVNDLYTRLDADPRVRLASDRVHIGVHADGWAGDTLQIRVLQGPTPVRSLRLACRQHSPRGGGLLRIRVVSPQADVTELRVDGNGEFELALEIRETRPDSRLIYRVDTQGAFIPAEVEAGSSDRRALAFRVDACRIEY